MGNANGAGVVVLRLLLVVEVVAIVVARGEGPAAGEDNAITGAAVTVDVSGKGCHLTASAASAGA